MEEEKCPLKTLSDSQDYLGGLLAQRCLREFTVESENFTSQEACSEYQFPGTSTCSNPTNLEKSVSRKRAHRFLYVAVTHRQ